MTGVCHRCGRRDGYGNPTPGTCAPCALGFGDESHRNVDFDRAALGTRGMTCHGEGMDKQHKIPRLTNDMIHGLTLLAETIDGRMISARTFDALRRRGLAQLRFDTAQHVITTEGLAALQHYAQTPRGSIRTRRALWNVYVANRTALVLGRS